MTTKSLEEVLAEIERLKELSPTAEEVALTVATRKRWSEQTKKRGYRRPRKVKSNSQYEGGL